ncbi:MFS transporter [Clostridium aestuarii]|uniref:MFS transporter n=1 Tax=Clostridium aestuarii TaxID=338193 RepID=A0ABT4D4A2_9CLOT|nr:MFS transporter [Clostridium aestuarii]MCY6485035.1 MFS transporter [Clostridium aestuarii]
MKKLIEKIEKLLNPYKGLPKEIYILFIARIINAAGAFIFPLLTLIFTKKLGMSNAQAGIFVTICGSLFLPSSIIGGKLTDTFGRKKVIVTLDTLAALSYITAALVGTSTKMIPFIMLASIFMGMSDPAHSAIIADLTTPKNRDGAYSLSYMGFNLGFSIGPILGGLLFENHLKLLFIGDAITALIATILIFLFIKETLHKTHENIGDDRNLEKRVEGSIFKVLLSRPILIWFSLIMFGYSFVYSQWSFMYPMYVEQSFVNEGAKLYGKLASFNGIIVITMTPAITLFLSKVKNIRRIFYGGIFYAVGFGMLGFANTKLAFFCSVFIFTIGEITIVISSTPFIINNTPASHRGRMNAILPLIMGFGHTIGPLIMGFVLKSSSTAFGWKIVGLVMIIFTLFMFILEKYDKKPLQHINKIKTSTNLK